MTMLILLTPNPLWVCTLNHFIFFHFKSLSSFLILYVEKNYVICFLLLAPNFVCNWLCLLFANCATTFVALKGRNKCLPIGLIFRDNVNIIAYLTMDHHKSLKMRRN
jgi:hypothetical protein